MAQIECDVSSACVLFYEISFYNFAVNPPTNYKLGLLETGISIMRNHLSAMAPGSPGHEFVLRKPRSRTPAPSCLGLAHDWGHLTFCSKENDPVVFCMIFMGFVPWSGSLQNLLQKNSDSMNAAKYYPQKYFLIYLWPQKCLCFCDPRMHGRAWGPNSTSKELFEADARLRSRQRWGRLSSLFSGIFYSTLSPYLLCSTQWHPHHLLL